MVASRVRTHWDETDVRVRPNKKGSRPRTKDRPNHLNAVTGRIITVDRGRYTAVVGEGTPDQRTLVAVRAKELRRNPVLVGDLVGLVGDTSGAEGSLARLVRIDDRSTLLRRSADDTDPYERAVVANASQLFIVVAAANPEPRTGFIDRALVAAFDAGIRPILCITKTDLAYPQELLDYYAQTDLTVLLSGSADGQAPSQEGAAGLTDSPIKKISAYLSGEVSVLLGPSGVGKSTLINALTGAHRETGHVNAVTGRGRHTSSSALALHPEGTPAGTWIIDTPGIRSFGLAHISRAHIVAAFTDLVEGSVQCPKGCSHSARAEHCGITRYVEAGRAGKQGPARLKSLRRLLGVNDLTGQGVDKELGRVSEKAG